MSEFVCCERISFLRLSIRERRFEERKFEAHSSAASSSRRSASAVRCERAASQFVVALHTCLPQVRRRAVASRSSPFRALAATAARQLTTYSLPLATSSSCKPRKEFANNFALVFPCLLRLYVYAEITHICDRKVIALGSSIVFVASCYLALICDEIELNKARIGAAID